MRLAASVLALTFSTACQSRSTAPIFIVDHTDTCYPADSTPLPPLTSTRTDTLPRGTVVVSVRTVHGNAPLEAVLVIFDNASPPSLTAIDGLVRVDSLSPGPHAVTLRRIGYELRNDTVDVPSGVGQLVALHMRTGAYCG
jgi:hypothetical protein